MSVRVYVEGGGDRRATLAECRRGFADFFAKVVPAGQQPAVIPCGSGGTTFEAFRTALLLHPHAFVILLVDSEVPVPAATPTWRHLQLAR